MLLQDEDDGVIMAVILKSSDKNFVGVILLHASNLSEIGRISAQTNSPKPMPLHGFLCKD